MELIIYIKMDSALNNWQRLIYHKTQQTNQPTKSHIKHPSLLTKVCHLKCILCLWQCKPLLCLTYKLYFIISFLHLWLDLLQLCLLHLGYHSSKLLYYGLCSLLAMCPVHFHFCCLIDTMIFPTFVRIHFLSFTIIYLFIDQL